MEGEPVVSRIGVLQAFQIEFDGRDCKCERLLVQEAFRLHRTGKMLVPIIDDAHLMQTDCLRKIRLLFESSEGLLRRARNLCIAALIETVRDQTKTADLSTTG